MNTKEQNNAITELILQALDSGNYQEYKELIDEFWYTENWQLEEDKKISLSLSSI